MGTVISPYKEQIYYLRHCLAAFSLFDKAPPDSLAVNTVDSFQGQERDIVYISFVRSNLSGEIGFLKDIRRTNVAMTRARKKLVMIGDSATLCHHPFYQDLLAYVEKNNAYQSVWEFSDKYRS